MRCNPPYHPLDPARRDAGTGRPSVSGRAGTRHPRATVAPGVGPTPAVPRGSSLSPAVSSCPTPRRRRENPKIGSVARVFLFPSRHANRRGPAARVGHSYGRNRSVFTNAGGSPCCREMFCRLRDDTRVRDRRRILTKYFSAARCLWLRQLNRVPVDKNRSKIQKEIQKK